MLAELKNKSLREGLSDFEWQTVASTSALSYGAALSQHVSGIRLISVNFARHEVGFAIEGALAGWMVPTVQSLVEALDLPHGWDSYGGKAIDPRCIAAALEMLMRVMRKNTPKPAVVPTSRGGIQLEWHTRGVDLEVEFLSPTHVRGLFGDLRAGTELESDLSFDQRPLTDAIGRLSLPA